MSAAEEAAALMAAPPKTELEALQQLVALWKDANRVEYGYIGRQRISVGTASASVFNAPARGWALMADPGNTDFIYVSFGPVDATSAEPNQGIPIGPGEAVSDPLGRFRGRITMITGTGTQVMWVVPEISMSITKGQISPTYADGAAQGTRNLDVIFTRNYLSNASTWDPKLNNSNITIFASAARTATANSADATNYNARGVMLILNITAVSGTAPTLDVKFQQKDSLSASYTDIPSASFTQQTSAVTPNALVMYPGVTVVANEKVSGALPRLWRAVATIAGTTPSFTFSVAGSYII